MMEGTEERKKELRKFIRELAKERAELLRQQKRYRIELYKLTQQKN